MKKMIRVIFLFSYAGILQAADDSKAKIDTEMKIRQKIAGVSTASPSCIKRIISAKKLADEMINKASKDVSPFVKKVAALNVGHKSLWEQIEKLDAKPKSEKTQQEMKHKGL